MFVSHRTTLITLTVVELLGIVVFMKGFFPIKRPVPGHAVHPQKMCLSEEESSDPICVKPLEPMFDRMIFVLVDALRADFVLPTAESELPQMEFVKELITRNETYSFLARAHPPTVTMPRIKAITTGGIPGFIDVILNFDSKELVEDNFLHQLKANDKKMAFYGDDTWLRLFPEYFLRSDGTTSFFVTDYTEVDDNVTRHIDPEMNKDDWDVMFLHYLGLDHIGHLAGPKSPLVQPKLKEMDAILQKLYDEVSIHDKERGSSTLLLLCGDHGMSDQGSHGGSTASETGTPFVLISPRFRDGGGNSYSQTETQQIDMTPAISMLLGLPIPQNNLGVLPLDITQIWGHNDMLTASYMNAQQLLNVLGKYTDDLTKDESYQLYQRALNAHIEFLGRDNKSGIDQTAVASKIAKLYHKAMLVMRNRVSKSLSRYDLHAMGFGALLLWINFIVILFQINIVRRGMIVTLNLDQSTFVLKVASTVCLLALCQISVCTSSYGSDLLCQWSFPEIFIPLVVGAGFICSVMILVNHISYAYIPSLREIRSWKSTSLFLCFGTVLHTLTLLASSFVEEEHQTWYFLSLSMIFVMVIDSCKAATVKTTRAVGKESRGNRFRYRQIFGVALFCICHRVARAWNRTGDKWAHLPDIGDWLVEPGQKVSLSGAVMISIVTVIIIAWTELRNNLSKLLFTCGCFGVYIFRASNGALQCHWLYEEGYVDKGVWEARFVYILVAVLLIKAVFNVVTRHSECATVNTNSELHYTWILTMLLLLKPHNICLVVLFALKHYAISSCLLDILPRNRSALTVLFVWLGQSSFYFQGNSNSIATVDVSAGYIGLDEYNPVVIGLLMVLNTFAGPIFWTFSLITVLDKLKKTLPRKTDFIESYTILMMKALPVAVYVVLVTIERHHLFVWSVFSPKLLYEGMSTLMYSILGIIVGICY